MNRQLILDTLRDQSRPERPVYLVGGAVRDQLLNRAGHDLDFVLPGDTLPVARAMANRLNGGLYVMDEARGTTRVVLERGDGGGRVLLDFASLRGDSLTADLFDRDFTVNAMAYDLAQPDQLIDPTGGLADLRGKRLRACSDSSLANDPVRVLRAVRIALALQLQILPDTIQQMRASAARLPRVSAERVRDETLRILAGSRVSLAVRILDHVGALAQVLPELVDLQELQPDQAELGSAWTHALDTARYLEQLMAPLVGVYREETVSDLNTGSAVLWLGRYRSQFEQRFRAEFVPDRPLRPLIFLSALYLHFFKPAAGRAAQAQGEQILSQRAQHLVLSAQEIEHLARTARSFHHFQRLVDDNIAHAPEAERRRGVYRFFKEARQSGVDICLLSLANLRAEYGAALPQDRWEAALETCRAVLEGCWERADEIVSPPRLLSGTDLMHELGLQPGKIVGVLLEKIEEAQAAGEVSTAEQALALARQQVGSQAGSGGKP